MAKPNFQQPLLRSSVSHNPLEIILICLFAAQKIFLIMGVEMLLNISVETMKCLFFKSFVTL